MVVTEIINIWRKVEKAQLASRFRFRQQNQLHKIQFLFLKERRLDKIQFATVLLISARAYKKITERNII